MSDEEKLVSHYRLKTLLRRDGFGAVYLAENTRDQKDMLLRVIILDQKTLTAITGRVRARSQRDHPLIERIRQRMKRIAELKHSHILSVVEFGEEHVPGNNDIIFYMASPFEKESLLSYWSVRNSNAELISLEIVAELVVQAAEALRYVHKHGLVHQYVRLSSFMLRSSARSRKPLHLLLTDFWFADITLGILEEGQMAQALSVYLAPEQLSQGAVITASDQYALAVLVYELLLGHRLSRVDLSLKLYETLVSQRASEVEVTASELTVARRLDLVLGRALAENPDARFRDIDEFAHTFYAVAHGEEIDLADEATFILPVVSQRGGQATAGVVGALAAGEVIAELAETQETVAASSGVISGDGAAEMLVVADIDAEKTLPAHGRSLHKTVLTSAGMEDLAQGAAVLEEVTVASENSETVLVAEETSSGEAAGAAGFAAGLVVGETLSEAAILAQETEVAAAASGQVGGITDEQTLIMAGDTDSQNGDIAEKDTLVIAAAGGAAALLASEAELGEIGQAGGAAGLVAGEIETSEIGQASSTAGEAGLAADEVEASEIALIGGAAGLAAGGIGLAETQLGSGAAGLAAAGSVAGNTELAETQVAAGAAGLVAANSATESTELAETQIGAGAAGLAAAGLAGATLAAGATWQAGSGTSVAGGTGVAGVGSGTGVAGVAGGSGSGASGGGLAATPGAPRRARRRPWLVAALIALVLLLVFAGVFAFALTINQSSATVTLTLQSRTIQTSYVMTAVTTTTSQGQVQARTLTSTITQSKSGQASGFFAGTHATGFISFHNTSTGCGCPIVIPAGTAFTSTSGVTVVTDTAASVASLCTVTVRAHAVIFGPGGDISAGNLHTTFSPHISATNPFAFSGGQAGQSNSLVQQSDINRLASVLQSQVAQSAQADISSQVKSSEHLLGTPLCQTRTTANHAAGSVATSVTVTVSTACKAEVYDYSGAVQIVQQQVQTQAATYFSDKFVLLGTLKTTVESATLVDAPAGKILLVMHAVGKWVYQFSNSLKQSLARTIAGKSLSDAHTTLANEDGVSAVNIVISGSDKNTLPDASKITIILKN